MDERWLPVVGNDKYEVSDLGRVRNAKTKHVRALGVRTNGYVYVGIRVALPEKPIKWPYVHLIVLRAFVGPAPTGMEANHKDLNRANNALHNLEYVTRSENQKHSRRVRGKREAHHRIPRERIEFVLGDTRSSYVLGRLLGIPARNVQYIRQHYG